MSNSDSAPGNGHSAGEVTYLKHATSEYEDRVARAINAAGEAALHMSRRDLAILVQGARDRRAKLFPDDILGEPGWDILLALYVSHCDETAYCVKQAYLSSRVAATTALRVMAYLERKGMIERKRDDYDRRRSFVCLSPKGIADMEAYLDEYASWVIEWFPRVRRAPQQKPQRT